MLNIYLKAIYGSYSELTMLLLHKLALYGHIIAGSIALLLFWYPVLVTKGSTHHNRAGDYYIKLMYIVAWSGIVCCSLVLIDPVAIRQVGELSPEKLLHFIKQNRRFAVFLLMLSLLTLASIYHGTRVLKAKANRQLLKTPVHLSLISCLMIMSVVTLVIGQGVGQILFMVFGILGLVISFNMFRYIFKKSIKQREWIIEHLGGMLGSGIAIYTAFSAVGGRHILLEIMGSQGIILSWIAPGVVGGVAIAWASRRFSQRYRIV